MEDDPSNGVVTAGNPRDGLDPKENGYPPCAAHLITDFGIVNCEGVSGHDTILGKGQLHRGQARLIKKTYTWDSLGEDSDRMKYAIGMFIAESDLDGTGD